MSYRILVKNFCATEFPFWTYVINNFSSFRREIGYIDYFPIMFRLTNKGNQSRKNHKIINQTTKISDTDAKLSQTAIQAAQLQEQPDPTPAQITPDQKTSIQPSAQPNPIMPPQDGIKVGLDDIQTYILKMNEYLAHMKMLETRNATLERENNMFKQENDHLKQRMNQMNFKNDIPLKPGAITQQLRKDFF